MKTPKEVQSLFEDKYEGALGMSYNEWLEKGPQNQDEAYERCIAIDKELERTYEEWYESTGSAKEELQEYRDKLKAEYDLLEEAFNLETQDRSW